MKDWFLNILQSFVSWFRTKPKTIDSDDASVVINGNIKNSNVTIQTNSKKDMKNSDKEKEDISEKRKRMGEDELSDPLVGPRHEDEPK